MLSKTTLTLLTLTLTLLIHATTATSGRTSCTPRYLEPVKKYPLSTEYLTAENGGYNIHPILADNDPHVDVVTMSNNGSLRIMFGGQLANASLTPVMYEIGDVAAANFDMGDFHDFSSIADGDLNGDGAPDLVTAARTALMPIRVWFNPGGSKENILAAPWPFVDLTSVNVAFLDIGDINNDGLLDIVATAYIAGRGLFALYNTGSPTVPFFDIGSLVNLGSVGPYPGGSNTPMDQFVIIDVDGDGDNDLVQSRRFSSTHALCVFEGFPTTSLTPDSCTPLLALTSQVAMVSGLVAGADVNGDNLIDFLVATSDNTHVLFAKGSADVPGSTLANGYGVDQCNYTSFDEAAENGCVAISNLPGITSGLSLADISRDGYLDLYVSILDGSTTHWTPFVPSLDRFRDYNSQVAIPYGSESVDAVIFELSPGIMGMVSYLDVLDRSGPVVEVFYESTEKLFTPFTAVGQEVSRGTLVRGVDLNLDGSPDLVCASQRLDRAIILPSLDAPGAFADYDTSESPEVERGETFAFVDLNFDGSLDIIFAGSGTGPIAMFLNDGAANFRASGIEWDNPVRLVAPGMYGVDYPAPWATMDVNDEGSQVPEALAAQDLDPVDMDDDGDYDLVFSAENLNMIGWIENNGSRDAIFNAATDYAVLDAISWIVHPVNYSISAKRITTLDANLDGSPDIVFADSRSMRVGLVLNQGIRSAPLFPVGSAQTIMFEPNPAYGTGDTVCFEPSDVSIPRDCDPLATTIRRPGFNWVSVGDLARDGSPNDLVASRDIGGEIHIAIANNDGTYQPNVVVHRGTSFPPVITDDYVSPRNPVIVSNWDVDDEPDIVFGSLGLADTLFEAGFTGVFLLRNVGNLTFEFSTIAGGRDNLLTTLVTMKSSEVIDLNGDTLPDLWLADEDKRTVEVAFRLRSVFEASRMLNTSIADYPCGITKTIACVYTAISSQSKCSEAVNTITLLPGVYTDCFTLSHGIVKGKVEIRPEGGNVVFDCAGRGVLFDVAPGSTLIMRDIEIRGTSSASSPTGTTALRVAGPGASLVLDNVSVYDAAPQLVLSVSQINPGYGSVLAVLDGGSATITHSEFYNSVAPVSGGVVAIFDSGSELVVSDTVMYDSSAANGLGGVVYVGGAGGPSISFTRVRAYRSSARSGGVVAAIPTVPSCFYSEPIVSIVDSEFLTSSASHVGGVVAVYVNGPVSGSGCPGEPAWVSLTNVIIGQDVGHTNAPAATAASGGVFAAFHSDGGTDGSPAGGVSRDAGSARTAISVGPGVSIVSSRARYGGIASACQAGIVLDPSLTVTERVDVTGAGGVAFHCNFDAAGGPFVKGAAELTTPVTASVDGYGDVEASAPARLVGVTLFPDSLETGFALDTGSFQAYDAFDEVVIDDQLSFEIVLPLPVFVSDAGTKARTIVTEGGSTQRVMDPESGLVSFADVILTRESNEDLDVSGAFSGVDPFGGNVQATLKVAVSATAPADASSLVNPVPDHVLNVTTCAVGTTMDSVEFVVGDADNEKAYRFSCRPDCGDNAIPIPTTGTGANVTRTYSDGQVSRCHCIIGTYPKDQIDRRPELGCLPCPSGGRCDGRFALPRALPGYYDISNNGGVNAQFRECPRLEACSGSNTCRTGHTGFMCSECLDEYYADPANGGLCTKCPPAASGITAIFIIVLVVGGIVAAVLLTVLKKANEDAQAETDSFKLRSTRVPYALSVGMVYAQVVGILAKSRYSWPPSTRSTMNVFNVFNLDVNIFASECSLGSFSAKYMISITYPLVFLVWVTLALTALRFLKGRASRLDSIETLSLVDTLNRLLVMVSPLLFIPLSRSALILFDCTELPDGNFYLDADLGKRCFDSAWWGLFPFGLTAVFVYVLGIPAFCGWTLYSNRMQLWTPEILARAGGLYRLYRRNYPYFELLQLAKRMAIVIASLFFSSIQVWQLGILFVVFGSFAYIMTAFDVYYNPVYNSLEVRLNLTLAGLTALGAAFWADDFPNYTSLVFFAIIAIALVLGGLVLIGFAAYREAKQRIAANKAAEEAAAAATNDLGGGGGGGSSSSRPRSIMLDPQQDAFWAEFEKRADDWEDKDAVAQVRSMRSSIYGADSLGGGVEMVSLDQV